MAAALLWDGRELWLDGKILGWMGPTFESERSMHVAGYHAFLFPNAPMPAQMIVDRVTEEQARAALEQAAAEEYRITPSA